MGDCQTEPLRPQFDRRLRLECHGATVTSDAGLLAYRELDNALQLTDSAADVLHDTRTGRNTRHSLAALMRQSLFSRLAGYETSTTPSACASIPRCAPWWVVGPGCMPPPRPARSPGSRPRRSRPART